MSHQPTDGQTQLFVHSRQSPTHSFYNTRPESVAHEQPSPAAKTSCDCITFTLGHSWGMVHEFAPLWDMTPTWQSEWTEGDIRKEECRRLVWSSVMLTAGHSSYTAASPDMETQQLFLMDPRNVSLSARVLPRPSPPYKKFRSAG